MTGARGIREANDMRKSIHVLLIGDGWAKEFPSIRDASEYIHISRNRIRRALDSPHGVIDGVYPQVCVDEAIPTGEELYMEKTDERRMA